MNNLVARILQKHIERDNVGNPIAVPYEAQYWDEYEDGRLVRFAGYRFFLKTVFG